MIVLEALEQPASQWNVPASLVISIWNIFFNSSLTNHSLISMFRPTDGMTLIFSYHLMTQPGFKLTSAQLQLL